MTPPDGQRSNESSAVVLHSPWPGLILTAFGTLVFLVFTIALIVSNGAGVVTLVLFALSLVAIAVVLIDMPIASSFDKQGVTRRTPLRRHHLLWTQIRRIDRVRSGVVRTRKQGRGGGLIAHVGRRTHALTGGLESWMEFDELRRVIGSAQADSVGLSDALRPAVDRSPTWSYRRKRWRPDL